MVLAVGEGPVLATNFVARRGADGDARSGPQAHRSAAIRARLTSNRAKAWGLCPQTPGIFKAQ